MTENYHDPLETPLQITVASVNTPLGQLDSAITDIDFTYSTVETEFLNGQGEFTVPVGTGASIDGHAITEEGGADLPQRAKLDFIGPMVTASNGVSATEIKVEFSDDTSPTLGGDLDLDGNSIVDNNTGTIDLNDAVDITGALGVTGNAEVTGNVTVISGELRLDNSKAIRIEDSAGTAQQVFTSNAGNALIAGHVVAGWGNDFDIRAGVDVNILVNGSSGTHKTAATFATSGDLQLKEDLQLENDKLIKQKDSGGSVRTIAKIDSIDQIFIGSVDASWTNTLYIRAGGVATINVYGASGSFIEAVRWDASGNQLLGTTTEPSANAGKVLVFGDNTADPTMGTNTAGIYAKDVSTTVEMFAVDEAGNATQLTSHDSDLIEALSDPEELHPYVLKSSNCYTGKEVSVDLIKLARQVEELSGVSLVNYRDVDQRDWDTDQQVSIDQRNAEIAKWNKDKELHDQEMIKYAVALDEYNQAFDARKKMKKADAEKLPELAKPAEPSQIRECPKPLTKKKMPKWIADRVKKVNDEK